MTKKNTQLVRINIPHCLVVCVSFLTLLSCTKTETVVISHNLFSEVESVPFQSGAGSIELPLETNIEAEDLSIAVASQGSDWCTATLEGNALKIVVTDNTTLLLRRTIVTVQGKNQRQDIIVTQRAIGFDKGKRMKVSAVTTTSEMVDHEARLMIDGDPSTYFNSILGAITNWPFVFNFTFTNIDHIDYIVHTPRQDSGNKWGAIGAFELWIATESSPVLTKYGDYDFKQATIAPTTIVFDKPIEKPTQIEFRISSGLENRVSCGEMEFMQKEYNSDYNYLQTFTDASCSELIPTLKEADLNSIPDLFYKRIALAMFKGTYDREFRIQNYRPYQHPDIQANINKTAKFSLRDNATGMYQAKAGEQLVVFVGETNGASLTLNIRDFQTNKETSFKLQTGLNALTPSIPGLIYILYHSTEDFPLVATTDADKSRIAAKSIKIHIATGEINGYFDIQKHTNEDWDRILSQYGKNTEIDVLGRYSHVTWRTSDYKDNNTNITLMTNYMDSIIRQQSDLSGLIHYKKEFKNRAYIHVDYSAPAAYASDYRTAYSLGYINVFCTEAGLLSRMWVIGHEIGHVNQVRPGVKWAGTTEVTNNLFAMYNQQQILGDAVRLNTGTEAYEFAFKAIIDAKQPWVLPNSFDKHMFKLPPFWQLKLYLMDIMKQTHFYHDLFEYYRVTPNLSEALLGDKYHGMLQLDFVRQTCRISKINLIEFFEEWGFLRPIDAVVNDYGNKTIKITQAQIDELKAEIEAFNYAKPAIKVQSLTDLTYRQYIK